ncbi:MAG TPA: polyprenyl synthetase family protein [Rhizomicrobium sp.]|nr:polyprenyl synthetase family protein [Rhizomicrobium sp.]
MITAEARKLDLAVSPVERLHGLVARDMESTDRLIHENLGSTASLIPELAKHLVDSGGKRLRPLLTLAAAKAGGYEGNAHILLAAAVEFIHTATLLHDDVVDASALRRGKASANIVWGNKPSVLVGDFLFSRAFQLMVEAGSMAVLDVLASASAIIAEGEVMQLKATSNLATGEDDYLRVVEAKTAALFSAAAQSGAMVSHRGPDFAQALRMYGHNLGIAFQLADDALDYSGHQALMGKSVGDDFREAKVTLPVILAYERADEEGRRFWRRTIESGTLHEGDLQHAIANVEGTGAIGETLARARRYADAASKALAVLPPSEIREALGEVAEFCVDRAY